MRRKRDYQSIEALTLIIIFLVLISGALFTFYPSFTGLFAADEVLTYSQSLDLEINENSTISITLENYSESFELISLKLSGKLLGTGTAKVYLEDLEGQRLLILDSDEIKDSGTYITGLAIEGAEMVEEELEEQEEIEEEIEEELEEQEEIEEEIEEELEEAEEVVEEEQEQINETEEEIVEEIIEEPEINETEEIQENITEEVEQEINITEQEPDENITEEINETFGNETFPNGLETNVSKTINITEEINITENITEEINITEQNITINITENITEENITINITQNITETNITNITEQNITENITEEVNITENITEEIQENITKNITEKEINITPIEQYRNVEILDIKFQYEWKDTWGTIKQVILDIDNQENQSTDIKYIILDVEGYQESADYQLDNIVTVEPGQQTITIPVHFSFTGTDQKQIRIRIKDQDVKIIASQWAVFDPKIDEKIKGIEFLDACVDTCFFPVKLNSTEYKLVFEIDSSTLIIDELEYVIKDLAKKFDVQFNILDKNGEVKSVIEINNNSITNQEIIQLLPGQYDVNIIPENYTIDSILFNSMNITNNFDEFLKLDQGLEAEYVVQSYVVKPLVEYSSARINTVAKGNALYKCNDWSYTFRYCKSDFEFIKPLIENESYRVDIGYETVAFLETIGVNATNISYKKIVEDPRYDAIIDSTAYDNETDTLNVVFHHDSPEPLPTRIKGKINYTLDKEISSAGESVTLIVRNWNNKRFRILVGTHTEGFEFGTPKKLKLKADIKDSKNKKVKTTIELIDELTEESKFTKTKDEVEEEVEEGEYDIKIDFEDDHPIKEINIKDVEIYEDLTELISVEDVNETEKNLTQYVEVYAIDPTEFNFTNATVTVTAKGNSLYKCKDWNFTTQTCFGNWTLFKTGLTPGQDYTFELTPEDPGFGEINITKAEHLASDYSFISDIYDETRYLDGNWSEKIYENEFVRVTFEENISNINTIYVYARGDGNSYFEVYAKNTTSPLIGRSVGYNGSTDNITSADWYQVDVENLVEDEDEFDFKIINDETGTGWVEFDYIEDPRDPADLIWTDHGFVVYESTSLTSGAGTPVCSLTLTNTDDQIITCDGGTIQDNTSYCLEYNISAYLNGNSYEAKWKVSSAEDSDQGYFNIVGVMGSGNVFGDGATVNDCEFIQYNGEHRNPPVDCEAYIHSTATDTIQFRVKDIDGNEEIKLKDKNTVEKEGMRVCITTGTGTTSDSSTYLYTYDNKGGATKAERSNNISFSAVPPDQEYPIFSNYWDDNATVVESGVGNFNVTVDSTNGTVFLEINGVNVTASNISNVFNASYTFSSTGDYTYRWHSWGNGTEAHYNVSSDRVYTVNVSQPPTHTTPLLSSTLGTNTTDENLTCYNQSTADADNDTVKNIYNWKKNGTSIAVLNMPFEGNAATDYSGLSNDGTITGATWNSTGGYDGKGAYEFDGSGDYITTGLNLGNSMNTTNWTLSAWIKWSGTATAEECIFGDDGVGADNLCAGVNDQLLWIRASGYANYNFANTNISDGGWHHVVFWGNDTNTIAYLDGVLGQVIDESLNQGNTELLVLGRQGGASRDWTGSIDDVQVFNYSLSPQQILALYQNRTDLIVSQETSANEVWSCQVTPNDGTEDGTTLSSNNLTIIAAADTTPPSSITNLANQSAGQTWIYWNWTNPSDSDFNHTEVWINQTFYANVTTPDNYYNATGLSEDTLYEIQTRTADNNNNVNSTWVNDTAKTLASCAANLTNTSWTSWINLTCIGNQMNQSRNRTQYDANNCGAANTTFYDYQLVGPTYQNTSWTAWTNISCLTNDTMNQTKNLTQYDVYVCASNTTFIEYKTNETCDYCTPNWDPINTSCNATDNLTMWYNDTNNCFAQTGLASDNNPPANQTFTCDYCTPNWYEINTSCNTTDNLTGWYNDSNSCYAQTGLESDNNQPANNTYTCDYCTYNILNTTWTSWQNQGICLINDSQKQNRSREEYDDNYNTCYAVTGLASDLWNSGNNNTYWEYNYTTCNYCTEDIQGPTNTTCNETDQLTQYYVDNNYATCCAVTGLGSDCSIDNGSYDNQTLTCDYDGPPGISIINPQNTNYNNTSVYIEISTSGALNTWFYNSTDNESYSSPVYRTFSEGENTINAWANDTYGNVNTTSVTFTIDLTAPEITLVRPTEGKIVGYSVTLDADITDTLTSVDSAWYEIKNTSSQAIVKSGTLSSPDYQDTWDSTAVADGNYTFIVYANDTLNNKNNESATFIVDNTQPFIQVLNPTNNTRLTENINLNITYQNTWLNTTKYNITNSTEGLIQSNTTNPVNANYYEFNDEVNINSLADGTYTITAYALDSVGYQVTEQSTFIVDNSAPKYSNINEPTDPSTYSSSATYNFNITFTDNSTDTVTLEFDGTNYTVSNIGNVYYKDFNALEVATHNYTWYANDTINNKNKTSASTFTINQQSTTLTLATSSWSDTYGNQTTVNCSASNNEITPTLYRNGTQTSIPDIQTLGAGKYNYICDATSTQNYSAPAQQQNTLLINKSTSASLTLTASPSWSEIDGTQTTINCSANNNEITPTLYRNGTPTSIPDIQTLAIGTYLYICNATQTQNYSAPIQQQSNLTINSNIFGSILTDPADQQTNRNTNATYTITITNNGTGTDTFNLTVNNSNNAETAQLNQTSVTLSASASQNIALDVTDDDTVGEYVTNIIATSDGNSSISTEISITTTINGTLSTYITLPENNPTYYEAQNITFQGYVYDELTNPISGATVTFEPISGSYAYICTDTIEDSGYYNCTLHTADMYTTAGYNIRINASKTNYNTASTTNSSIFILGDNREANYTLTKSASVESINATLITYNITNTLTNVRGTSENTNLTDPDNNQTWELGELGAETVTRSYLRSFNRMEDSEEIITLNKSNASGYDPTYEKTIFAESNQPSIIVPERAIEQLTLIKNLVSQNETDTNITYEITIQIVNSGDVNFNNVEVNDTDINLNTYINITSGDTWEISDNTTIQKNPQPYDNEFARASAQANETVYYSNQQNITIPGYGGPYDVIIIDLPDSISISQTITGQIQITNQNTDVEDDRTLTTWIEDEDESILDIDIRTVFVDINDSITTSVSLTAPSTAGTYYFKSELVWPTASADATNSFTVTRSSGESGAGSSTGTIAIIPIEEEITTIIPICGDSICHSNEILDKEYECLKDCGYDCNNDNKGDSWTKCIITTTEIPEDVKQDIITIKNKINELEIETEILEQQGAETQETEELIEELKQDIKQIEEKTSKGEFDWARNLIKNTYIKIGTPIIIEKVTARVTKQIKEPINIPLKPISSIFLIIIVIAIVIAGVYYKYEKDQAKTLMFLRRRRHRLERINNMIDKTVDKIYIKKGGKTKCNCLEKIRH